MFTATLTFPPPDPGWLDAQNVEKRSVFYFSSERNGRIESTGRATAQMVLLFVVAVGMICLLFLFRKNLNASKPSEHPPQVEECLKV